MIEFPQNHKGEILSFEFDKSHIKNKDLSTYLPFLEDLVSNPDKVFKYMHRVVFHVNGYDLDPRGLSVIPEVVEFFKELHKQWPYFLFFCAPMEYCFAWWAGVVYFPVVGREDGNATFMEVTPDRFSQLMGDFFTHANTLDQRFGFPHHEYMIRQGEMTQAINKWCTGESSKFNLS